MAYVIVLGAAALAILAGLLIADILEQRFNRKHDFK